MRQTAGILANIAIPLWCVLIMFTGAFGIFMMPQSMQVALGTSGSIIFAQMFFWSSLAIVVGLVIQIFKPLEAGPRKIPLYAWFEYPGLITASILAFVYGMALLFTFGLATSFVALGFSWAISTRFFFRWLDMHLTFFRKEKKLKLGDDLTKG